MSSSPFACLWAHPAAFAEVEQAIVLQAHQESADMLQAAVDALAGLLAQGQPLSAEQQGFLHALCASPAWGGKDLAFNACAAACGLAQKPLADLKETWFAQLHSQFMSATGTQLAASRALFGQSALVQDTVRALKAYIKKEAAAGRQHAQVSTESAGFLTSNEALQLESRRNAARVGYLFADGSLVLEQHDPRPKRIYDRFIIQAHSHRQGPHWMTRWKITGRYLFGQPEHQNTQTLLPLGEMAISVPLSLPQAAQDLGLARGFYYRLDWLDTWQ
jgi:hypothetical protein